MKKRLLLVLAICLCCLLSGCCLKHDWQAATCTEPETCAKCGKTQGEALGHDWTEATCTAPKTCANCDKTRGEALGHDWTAATCTAPETCAKCGETQGEALSHDWIEATCWAPETCALCGETQGEVLTPDFEIHGLTCTMEPGETYDYLTACYEDMSITTIGKATVTTYEAITPALAEDAIDGYEWRRVSLEISFSDENANAHGMMVGWSLDDYYDIEGHDEYSEWYGDSTGSIAMNWNGQFYDQCIMRYSEGFGEWTGDTAVYTFTIDLRLPVDYDGIVLSLYNRQSIWEDEYYIYDVADADSLFFRLTPID